MKLQLQTKEHQAILTIDLSAEASLSDLRRFVTRLTKSLAPPDSSIHLSLNGSDELPASSDALGFSSGDYVSYSHSGFCDSISFDYYSSEEGSEDDMEICGGGSGRFPESFVSRLCRALRLPGESRCEGFELILSVHCVLLESGFVRFDSASGKRIDDEVDVVGSSTTSLNYTLPAILEKEDERPFVVVKFLSMESFVNVFAHLNNGGSGSATYRLCLGQHRFSNAIGIGNWAQDSAKDLSELWTMVRDEVALPLMIDLCAKAGLPAPPCLVGLPSELQMKILQLLPGDDIARAACTCKELHNLASTSELLPESRKSDPKDAFKEFWLRRERRKEEEEQAARTRSASQAWRRAVTLAALYERRLIHSPSELSRSDAQSLLGPGMFLPPQFGLPSWTSDRCSLWPDFGLF